MYHDIISNRFSKHTFFFLTHFGEKETLVPTGPVSLLLTASALFQLHIHQKLALQPYFVEVQAMCNVGYVQLSRREAREQQTMQVMCHSYSVPLIIMIRLPLLAQIGYAFRLPETEIKYIL